MSQVKSESSTTSGFSGHGASFNPARGANTYHPSEFGRVSSGQSAAGPSRMRGFIGAALGVAAIGGAGLAIYRAIRASHERHAQVRSHMGRLEGRIDYTQDRVRSNEKKIKKLRQAMGRRRHNNQYTKGRW